MAFPGVPVIVDDLVRDAEAKGAATICLRFWITVMMSGEPRSGLLALVHGKSRTGRSAMFFNDVGACP